MPIIYHIASEHDWDDARAAGNYTAASFAAEGFIHCSLEHQVDGVLARYYAGKTGLVKLHIDTDKLTSRLEFERAASVGEDFPHIYGPINIDAVIQVVPISPGKYSE